MSAAAEKYEADRLMRTAADVAALADSESLQTLIMQARGIGVHGRVIAYSLELVRKVAQKKAVELLFASGRAA